ncbi:MAG: hypothetical protein EHM93_16400 [Bacteroidales bacterium]|nr:MAG: hypothetical protein EHM93_16400 [Bacteroidales bacterium]
MESAFSVVILASGLSERMGEPKALLRWDSSTTFIEKIIVEYSNAGCSEIICVINKKIEPLCKNLKLPSNVKFAMNLYPEWGRFYSIKIGTQGVLNDYCFIQNVDNPFVSFEIIKKIFAERNSEAWCSPVYKEKGGHPIMLPKKIIQKLPQINDNDMSLAEFLKPFKRINIETQSDLILRNLNNPEDYARFLNQKT